MEALLVLGDDPSLREGVKDLIRIGQFKISYILFCKSLIYFPEIRKLKNIDFEQTSS